MYTTHRFIGNSTRDAWIIAAVVTQSLLAGTKVLALPTDGQVAAGRASITMPSATTMQIGQESNHAIINWNSFGIGKGERVTIAQPTSQSTILNRVLGNDPSSIFGTLTANGRVFLVNPNGMMFAPGANINAGGLVASTLSISDSDFLSEKYAFSLNGAKGSLLNHGSLTGGFVALLGDTITNTGTIITTKGSAGVATGNEIVLDLDPSGLVSIKVDKTEYNARITNSGVIEAEDGNVFITASAANDLLGTVVNNSGKIRATRMIERDGNIVIEGGSLINTGTVSAQNIRTSVNNLVDGGTWSSDGGSIRIVAAGTVEQTVSGSLSADGGNGGTIHIDAGDTLYLSGKLSAAGSFGKGGNISVTAPQTTLAGANVSADGTTGGGTILVGGGWQGNDSALANSTVLNVTKSSKLSANAEKEGDGGTVVLWSDQSTAFAGTIESRGGTYSGNGGKVEISSHENLGMTGQVDLSAIHGKNGQLLLDPRNITIDTNATPQLFSAIPLLDANPAAGDQHGSGTILELPNGNIVVASPLDDFAAIDAGAVRLYKPDGTLLSMLSGSTANDQVGESVIALTGNNNAITATRKWSNAGVAGAGAVTWIDGNTGVSGSVSESNSLIGSTLNDAVLSTITPLSNGNFVAGFPGWDNGTLVDVGATVWGNGAAGTVGIISPLNSLIGSGANDGASSKVTALSNGRYVVSSPLWDKGAVANVGAVTLADGSTGTTGVIGITNSLTGSKSGDNVGLVVTPLANGNFVVGSPNWDGSVTNAGAVTWVDGLAGMVGTPNATNSLVGSTANDKISSSITALSNGHYVAVSSAWDNGTIVDAGAVTWGNGSGGTVGTINTTNSLVGSTTGDALSATVLALTNGHYVAAMPNWDNGTIVNAGAITWGDGVSGTAGTVSATNSLVGSTANDGVAYTLAALKNGHYIVGSPNWDNGTAIDVGAVTWGNGNGGTVGSINTTNSLIGSTANDGVVYNITPLANGNYVVGSPNWDNGTVIDAGAVTCGNGTGGTVGTISALNSIIGTAKNDFVGSNATGANNIIALKNSNYVISSPVWDKGTALNAGAVTWGDGAGGTVGEINATNSLTGSKTGDNVGSLTVALSNGNYVVGSANWDNGSLANAGAITLGNGLGGVVGSVSSTNSLAGNSKDYLMSSGGIIPLSAGSMNGSFIVSSMNWSNNTGLVDLLTPKSTQGFAQQVYSADPGTDNTFTPDQLTALLNSGSNVVLQANNNLTVNSAIVANNPNGNGGNLDLNAGQSIFLNANITTDNGNLTLIANDKLANGVVDGWRSPGNAVITMSAGSNIDAGGGNVAIEMRDGEGRGNRESGDITLRNISAGRISALNYGTTAGSGITLASGTLAASLTNGNTILLAGKDFDNSGGATLSTAGTARWLVYSDSPGVTSKNALTSDFRHYSAPYSSYMPDNVVESGNGFIYSGAPPQLLVNTTLATGQASSVYGNTPDATFGYTLSGFTDNEDNVQNIGLTGTTNVSGVPTAISGTGNYTISYVDGLSSSKGFTFTPGTGLLFTVSQQTVNVIADPQGKPYGTTDPPLTWQTEGVTNGRGLIPGDTFTGELSRVAGEDVNNYAILQNTLGNNNYTINYTPAYLTINQRPITLNAIPASTVYGEADPLLGVSINNGSLGSVSVSDTLSDVTGILNRQNGTNVGTYNINLGSGIKAANYAITFESNNGAFAITQRPVNVLANALSKTYGDADPLFTWSAEGQSSGRGLISGDTFDGALGRAAGENVSSYAITRNTLNNSNYAINYTAADLTINQRPITLMANAASSIYGELNPALGVTITEGTLGSETVSDLLSDLTGTVGRQDGNNVGSYDITLGAGSKADNYAITFNTDNNAFSITPRPLVIAADAQNKTYGDADPTLTWTAEAQSNGRGLIAGDSFNGALGRNQGENVLVGNYRIEQNTLDNSNYAISYSGDYLTIRPRPITLSATPATKIYGETDPALAVAISTGSLGSTTVADVLSDVTGTLSRQAGSATGNYDIALGTGTKASNYDITFATDNNALSITKRPVNVAANALSKTYGDADPALTWQAEVPGSAPGAANQPLTAPANTPNLMAPAAVPVMATTNLVATNNLSPSIAGNSSTTPPVVNGFIAATPITVPEPAATFFSIILPGAMFTHSSPDAVITLEAGTVNGSTMPSWMSFDPASKVISGTPPTGVTGDYQVEVIARDQFGGEFRTTVLIKVG